MKKILVLLFLINSIFCLDCVFNHSPLLFDLRIINSDDWKIRTHGLNTCGELELDILLMYKTLFPNRYNNFDYNPRIEPLKKLFLLMTFAGLKINGKMGEEWPLPLASSLCHGGRILIELRDVQAYQEIEDGRRGKLFKFIFGELDFEIEKRSAASHDLTYNQKLGNFEESRLKLNVVKNLWIGYSGGHLGLNIPFGGTGNRGMNDLIITEDGRRIGIPNPHINVRVNEIQHGHMYIQPNIFPEKRKRDNGQIYNGKVEAILVGIEGTEPDSYDQYLHKHDFLSPFYKQEISITGGPKMSDLLRRFRLSINQNGGLVSYLDDIGLSELEVYWKQINLMSIQNQKQFFFYLLSL